MPWPIWWNSVLRLRFFRILVKWKARCLCCLSNTSQRPNTTCIICKCSLAFGGYCSGFSGCSLTFGGGDPSVHECGLTSGGRYPIFRGCGCIVMRPLLYSSPNATHFCIFFAYNNNKAAGSTQGSWGEVGALGPKGEGRLSARQWGRVDSRAEYKLSMICSPPAAVPSWVLLCCPYARACVNRLPRKVEHVLVLFLA